MMVVRRPRSLEVLGLGGSSKNQGFFSEGSTISAPTVTMDKINPKDCQVASPLEIQGFSNSLGLFQVMKWQTLYLGNL